MTTNIRCPECGTVLRVPSSPAGTMFRCPKCSQPIRMSTASSNAAAATPATAAPPAAAPSAAAPAASVPPVFAGAVPPQGASPTAGSSSAAPTVGGDVPLRPFLIRFAIVLGGVTVLLLALGLAGLASEPVAIAATVAMIVAMVACLMTGQVWMAIAAIRQNALLGVAIFFVPLVGLVLGMIQKGRILCGAIIYISALVPAVLGLLFIGLYQSRHTSQGRAAARTAGLEDDRPGLEAMIRNTEKTVAADAPLTTAKFRYVQIGPNLRLTAAKAESILSPFEYYVKGSFQIDEQAKTVQFDYRGPPRLATQYRLLLYNRTQVMLIEVPGG
ncbi:zinc ribbon domain-containing protein [Roseimaritima ulvae]|uniref:Uncharacterized protein n=1 Tax=Roseimaritima ulvae TaxID=980254 RepID=A0A5B9QW96_9BACT|nr:hypothetical protein [Roseimaritima ulvae]QEG43318.1 hypothetical protein UC8_53650 [Roseimaritima ulvae]